MFRINKRPYLIKISFPIFCLACISICSCGPSNSGDVVDDDSTSGIKKPDFNADSAFHFVKQQVDFGPRVPGTPAHSQCAMYLATKLGSYTDTLIVQKGKVTTFDKKILDIQNIIGSFNPNATKRILLCAHWDTRPFADQDIKNTVSPIDGANDGGSGVAVLLELARQLSMKKTELGIDIIFFDAEDWGDTSNTNPVENSYCLGSQYWGRNLHKPGYYAEAGVLLDMVGGFGAKFGLEGYSQRFNNNLLEELWYKAGKLGYGDMFIREERGAITDDHVYVNQATRIPMVDIIQYDPQSPSRFAKYWHTHNDNLASVDKNTLAAVGTLLHYWLSVTKL